MNHYHSDFIREEFEMSRGKRYDREFQLEAARLVVEKGYSKSEVSRKLGVTTTSITRWIDRFRENGELVCDGQVTAEADDLVICADVIEHLIYPNELMKFIASISFRILFLSTTNRDILVKLGTPPLGPPKNEHHIREWTQAEFIKYTSQLVDIIGQFIFKSNGVGPKSNGVGPTQSIEKQSYENG